MHSDEPSSSKLLNVLNIFGAIIVGVPLWIVFFAFWQPNAIGIVKGKDTLLAFAPIIGLSIPFAISKFGHSPGVSSWNLAFAPLLSVANLLACAAVSVNNPNRDVVLLAFSLGWAIPLLAYLYLFLKRQYQAHV